MLYIDWQPSIEVFRVGIFSLKWYSLLWMFGLMIAYIIVKHLYKQQGVPKEKFYPQFFYCFIGVLAGARLGHCIFYQPDYFLIYRLSGIGFTRWHYRSFRRFGILLEEGKSQTHDGVR